MSILPAILKLLERVVHTQLVSYLQENRLLSPFQCGFRNYPGVGIVIYLK